MPPGTAAAVRSTAVAAGLAPVPALALALALALTFALALGGCGQLTTGEQSPAGGETGTVAAPELTPGPAATPGCEELVGPVHRLVTGQYDTGQYDTDQRDTQLNSSEVRRLAAGVEDNALSAVASRLSGLVLQDTVDPDVVDAEWDQFRQLCNLP